MNLRTYFRLIIPTVALAASALGSQACTTTSGAPFHMYDSPLLEGRVESRYPRSRSFDPLEVGDHVETSTDSYYAQSDDEGAGRATRVSTRAAKGAGAHRAEKPRAKQHHAKRPPALATRRRGATPNAGATEDTHDSARASREADTTTAAPDTSAPALAADYVWSVYKLNGVQFSAGSRRSLPKLFQQCKKRGKIYHSSKPAIGDIVFFHNTGDYNGDGRNNDWYTFAAIVESRDGARVTLLGYRGGKVQRFVMDLQQPDAAMTRRGETANSQLRKKRTDDPPFTQYLAGQLFAGTCSVLGDRTQLVVVDNWKPGMKLSR